MGLNSSNTVQVSQHAHLAPVNVRTSFNRDEIRQLVLEYLISSCYVDSAKAFAQEVDALDQSVDEGIIKQQRRSSAEGESRAGISNGHERGNGTTNGQRDGTAGRNGASPDVQCDSHAMEGVEATPEPELAPRIEDDEDAAAMDGSDGTNAESYKLGSTSNGMGKKVMFESVEHDLLEDDCDTSLLSAHRLKKARHRRRECTVHNRSRR
jgi:hypothetical protein